MLLVSILTFTQSSLLLATKSRSSPASPRPPGIGCAISQQVRSILDVVSHKANINDFSFCQGTEFLLEILDSTGLGGNIGDCLRELFDAS
jgi:hypothetical protein